MNPRIRPVTNEDIETLKGLYAKRHGLDLGAPHDRKKLEKGIAMAMGSGEEVRILVAEEEGQVIGAVTGQILLSVPQGGLLALVSDLTVAREFRGKGVGSHLLAGIEKWARSLGADRLIFLADFEKGPSEAFCKKAGWRKNALTCLIKQKQRPSICPGS